MTTVAIIGKNKNAISKLKKDLSRHHIPVATKKPDIIIALGGDGTFLLAERRYPGIPKLLMRDSLTCAKCNNEPASSVLHRIASNKYRIERHIKLEARANTKRLLAVNDIVIRNAKQYEALRFNVFVNNKQIGGEFIGDGITIATPYGSTGYFSSITRKHFSKGVGIAFNNTTVPHKPVLLPENALIKVAITRTTAHVSADNTSSMITVKPGNVVIVKNAKVEARLVSVKN